MNYFWHFQAFIVSPAFVLMLSSLIFLVLILFWYSNPVLALVSMVCIFLLATINLFILNLDYLGLVLLIIYGGAIAILFLFVLMLIDLKTFFYPTISLFFLCLIFPALLGSADVLMNIFNGFSELFELHYLLQVLQVRWRIVFLTDELLPVAFFFFNLYSIYLILVGLILLITLIGTVVLLRASLAAYLKVERLTSKSQATVFRTQISFFSQRLKNG